MLNTKCISLAIPVWQISDETGRTIAMDVEPNFSYVGGYGRKTFLPLSRLERIDGVKEVWALVSPHSKNSEHQLAKFCMRVLRQSLAHIEDNVEKLQQIVNLRTSLEKTDSESQAILDSRKESNEDFFDFSEKIKKLLEEAKGHIENARNDLSTKVSV